MVLPTAISNLKVWLDANALNLNNNDDVISWTDQSGESRNADYIAGTYPKFITNALNNLPAVRFFDSHLESSFGEPIEQPNTIFLVFKMNVQNSAVIIFDGHEIGERNYFQRITSNNDFQIGSPTSRSVNASSTGEEFKIITIVYNNAQSSFKKNGEITASNLNTGTNPLRTFRLGANVFGTRSFQGDAAEIIFYNKILTETETRDIEEYLSDKYNISIPIEPKNFQATASINFSLTKEAIQEYTSHKKNYNQYASETIDLNTTATSDYLQVSIFEASATENINLSINATLKSEPQNVKPQGYQPTYEIEILKPNSIWEPTEEDRAKMEGKGLSQ